MRPRHSTLRHLMLSVEVLALGPVPTGLFLWAYRAQLGFVLDLFNCAARGHSAWSTIVIYAYGQRAGRANARWWHDASSLV
jgi:hypothetical protein